MTKQSSKTIDQLKKLDDKQLLNYFGKYARYVPDAPKNRGQQYVIRCGGKLLMSDDTADLMQKFKKRCRL